MTIQSSREFGDAAPLAKAGLKAQAASGAIWISFESIGTQILSLAVFAVMARFISPLDFGLISISFMVLQTLRPIILEGIAHWIILKPSSTPIEYSTAFWMTIATSTLAFAVVFLLAAPAEYFFNAPGLTNVMRGMSVITLFAGLGRIHEVWLSRHFEFRSLALRGLAGAISGGITGVLLAWDGYGVGALVVQQLVNSSVSLFLLWRVCPWRPQFRVSFKAVVEIWHFMLKLMGNTVFWLINQNSDTFLVAYFYGPAEAGIYNLGKRLRLALQLAVSSPISSVLTPALGKESGDPVRLNRVVVKGLTVTSAICTPLYFGAAAIAAPVIALIFGPKWQGVAPFFSTLCFATLAGTIIDYNNLLLLLHKRQIMPVVNQVLYLVLSIGIFFIARSVDVANFALPFAVPYLVVLPVSIGILARYTDVKMVTYLKAILPSVAAALIMFLALAVLSYLLASYSLILQLIALISSGAALYVAVLWIIDRHTVEIVFETAMQILSPLIGKLKMRSNQYLKTLNTQEAGE